MRPRDLVPLVLVGSMACDEPAAAPKPDHPPKTAPAAAPKPSPAKQDDEVAAVPAKPAPKPEAKAAPQDNPAPTQPPVVAKDPATSPWSADVSVTVADPKAGALRVAAAQRDTDSVVWAQRLTKSDTAAGPATKLRITSGEVIGLASTVSGGTLWVAWRSDLGGEKNQITALAGFDSSLANVHRPRILRTIENPPAGDDNLVLQSLGGGRVAVAALVGTRPCKGMHPDEKGSCRGLQVDIVAADGSAERSETRWLDGGDGSVDGLVDVGSGVVASFHVWHGGPLTDVALVPADPAKPLLALPHCDYPPVIPAVAGASVITLCPDPAGDQQAEVGCKASGEGANCGFMSRVDLAGKAVAPSTSKSLQVPLSAVTKRCDDKNASVRLAWKGGEVDVPPHAFGVDCP